MVVLQINSNFESGSTGKIVVSIHKMLIRAGSKSYAIYGRGNKRKTNGEVIRIGDKFELYIHGLLTRLFDMHGVGSKKATLQLITRIKQMSPDIIHLHNLHGYYLNIKRLFEYLKLSRAKVIWTFHDCWAFTGHCAYFDYVGCDKWQKECFDCPQKNRYPKSWLFDNSSYNFKKKKELFTGIKNLIIVVPSNWLAGLVKKSFLREYQIELIRNGIDLNTFRPRETSFRQRYGLVGKFIILGVANIWDERKGMKYFYELEHVLKDDEMIVLVGTNKGHIKNTEKIIKIGKTENQQQLAEIYSAADAFVNTTLEDNFPTTNLEALACGTPVITFKSGGSPEAIDEKTGFVVEKGNMDDLINKIRYIKRVGKTNYTPHCRELAQKNYSDKDMAARYIALYEKILSKNQ